MLVMKEKYAKKLKINHVKMVAFMALWVLPLFVLCTLFPLYTSSITIFAIGAIFATMLLCQYLSLKDVAALHDDYCDQIKDMQFAKLTQLIIQQSYKRELVQNLVAQVVYESSAWDLERIQTNNESLVRKIPTLRVIDIKQFEGKLSKSEKVAIERGFLQLMTASIIKIEPQKTLRTSNLV